MGRQGGPTATSERLGGPQVLQSDACRCSHEEAELPSALGEQIRDTRRVRGLSVRGLAHRIRKSPGFVSMIEKQDPPPGIAEETLRSIADVLALDPDRLITLAGKTPRDVAPADEVDVAIYRLAKSLGTEEKQALLRELQDRTKPPPGGRR